MIRRAEHHHRISCAVTSSTAWPRRAERRAGAGFGWTVENPRGPARIPRGQGVVRRVACQWLRWRSRSPATSVTPTGGYAYDRQVLARLASAWRSRSATWPCRARFRGPRGDDLDETLRLSKQPAAEVRSCLIDGLAYGALPPDIVARISAIRSSLWSITRSGLNPVFRKRGCDASHRERDGGPRACRRGDRHKPDDRAPAGSGFRRSAGHASVWRSRERSRLGALRATGGLVQVLAVGSLVPRKGYDVLDRGALRPAGLAWD